MKLLIAALIYCLCLPAALADTANEFAADITFGVANGRNTFFSGGGSNPNLSLIAVLPRPGTSGGYWVLWNSAPPAALTRSFNFARLSASGLVTFGAAQPLLAIVDVADAIVVGDAAHEKIYLLGTSADDTTGPNLGIECLDVANGVFSGDCAGFGGELQHARIDFNQGGAPHRDVPNRLAYYNGYLYAAAHVSVGADFTDYAVGVAKLSASTGALADGWGNLPAANGLFVRNFNYVANGNDIPSAIVVGPANPQQIDFRVDVFVAGTSDAGSNDTDGWVMAIDDNLSDGAQLDSVWNGGNPRRFFFDLGTTRKQDAITAMSQRHNGNLLIAGTAADDDDDEMLLGEIKPNGATLSTFAGGGVTHAQFLSYHQRPVAISERPGLGDFVVASTDTLDFFGDGHLVAGLSEFSPSATTIRAYSVVDIPADTVADNATRAASLIVDGANRVLLGGYFANAANYPGGNSADTLFAARFTATDTLFANGFGGAYHD